MSWIDFEEMKPKSNKPVLILFETEFFRSPIMVVAINFDNSGVMRALEGGRQLTNVTHWCELPDLPEA